MTSKHFIPAYYYVERNSKLSIQDYWKEQTDYWYPKLIEGKNKVLEVMSHLIDEEVFPMIKSIKMNQIPLVCECE